MEQPSIQPYGGEHQEADDEAEYPQRCITATNDKGPAAKQGEGQNGARFVAEVGPHFTQGRECRDARDASFVSPESSGGSKIYPVQIYSRGCNHGADYPFDFSTIGSRRRRTGFCDLHRRSEERRVGKECRERWALDQ